MALQLPPVSPGAREVVAAGLEVPHPGLRQLETGLAVPSRGGRDTAFLFKLNVLGHVPVNARLVCCQTCLALLGLADLRDDPLAARFVVLDS